MNDDCKWLANAIEKARHLVVFTGAGISAESGISTYRGDDGIWNRYDPNKFADINQFLADSTYYWNFFREVRYPMIAKARPNPAHLTLANLERNGTLKSVITQNIDGLHQMAGSKQVLELHGNTRRINCLKCGHRHAMGSIFEQLDRRLPPLCVRCAGAVKPDVVFFGEALPAEVLTAAVEQSRACDLFVVVGSSLVVHPAAALPAMAGENGARLVVINKDPTPMDHLAVKVFRQPAAVLLGGLGL